MNHANQSHCDAEQLSALADSALSAEQARAAVQACAQDTSLMQTWASYHTIGDVLRANARDARSAAATKAGTINLAPVMSPAVPQAISPAVPQAISQAVPQAISQAVPQALPPAANDSVFRWKLVAGFAAVAAVGSMLWATVGSQGMAGGAQLAQNAAGSATPTAVASVVSTAGADASANAQVMIRDPRLDELLAAHKQFGGASALQQPAGFLRNATFQPTGR
jgi:sigma-E factor negative regulatory protein RseA